MSPLVGHSGVPRLCHTVRAGRRAGYDSIEASFPERDSTRIRMNKLLFRVS